jgi:hypothetical protein
MASFHKNRAMLGIFGVLKALQIKNRRFQHVGRRKFPVIGCGLFLLAKFEKGTWRVMLFTLNDAFRFRSMQRISGTHFGLPPDRRAHF